MFRSRKSSQSNAAAAKSPTTAAAATAAAQAFLANRASNANLSSAAAAAALRTHTTSPTPVSEVQTKRTQRRGSISSNGSAAVRPGVLQRQGSSGSMTERTFRDQSPSRPSSSHTAEKPPPVPSFPQNLAANTTKPAKKKLVRRPSSAEPPQRITSPVPNVQGGRGVSLDRSGSIPKSEPPPLPTSPRLAKLDTTNLGSPSVRAPSVNFSRPMSPQLPTPVSTSSSNKSPVPQNKTDQSAKQILSSGDVSNIEHSVQNAATGPVKKKKKKIVPEVTEGSHLSAGYLSGKPRGTAVDVPTETRKSSVQSTLDGFFKPVPKPTENAPTAIEAIESKSTPQTLSPSNPVEEGGRSTGRLTKQPSIVKEDREGEEAEDRKSEVEAKGLDNKHALVEKAGEQNSRQAAELPTKARNGVIKSPTTNAIDQAEAQGTKDNKTEQAGLNAKPSLATDPQAESKAQKRLSQSPSRSAHFSARPVLDAHGMLRHEPPVRAASPAKSALKRSPSPRVPSPSGLGTSEISDTMSVGSDEGVRSGKKKKNVRVSFDDEALVVGEGADPQSNTNSPILFSPQNREPAKRPFFSFRKDKRDLGSEDVMSPVPKLPSFGSIRGRREKEGVADDDAPFRAFYGDEQAHRNLRELTSPSDFAVGAVLAQDAASKVTDQPSSDPNEPLPPEVTTVEGSGYHSDLDSSSDEPSEGAVVKSTEFPGESASSSQIIEPSTSFTPIATPKYDADSLPTIAVQPATPGQQSAHDDRDSWLGNMPGSFPAMEFHHEPDNASEKLLASETPASTRAEILEPEPEATAREQDPETPSVGQVSEAIKQQTNEEDEESDGSGASIYSDAAEDAADLEGDGFGSINAIVDSPVPKALPTATKMSDDLNTAEAPGSSAETDQTGDKTWDSAKTFWSDVNQKRKGGGDDKLVKAASSVGASSPKTREDSSEPLAGRKKKTSEPIAPPPKSRLRQNPEATPMRKSMRSPPPPSQNDSTVPLRFPVIGGSRQQEPAVDRISERERDTSLAQAGVQKVPKGSAKKLQATTKEKQPVPKPRKASENGHLRASMRSPPPITKSPLPPQNLAKAPKPVLPYSNDSDSDSSFKRARRRSTNKDGQYSMRRSMRASPAEGRPQSAAFDSKTTTSPRTSLSQRPMSSTGFGMRTSLRDNSQSSIGPSRQFGLSKGLSKPKLGMRKFSNDSDEGRGPTTFQSRFADSSDEDEPTIKPLKGFQPVRGIPKRIDEGDSTDLEDSDVGSKQKQTKPLTSSSSKLPPQINGISKSQGSALASGSLRQSSTEPYNTTATTTTSVLPSFKPPTERRRSFFGALGRKQKDKPKFKPDTESAARRDTPLERSKLARINTDAVTSSPSTPQQTSPAAASASSTPAALPPLSTTGSPTASRGKLQRRVTPQRVLSDSWPLPPPIPESPSDKRNKGFGRPRTADGSTSPSAKGRPWGMGGRRTSSHMNTDTNESAVGAGEGEGDVTAMAAGGGSGSGSGVGMDVVGRTGKKKRFPMLRKAFGLHD